MFKILATVLKSPRKAPTSSRSQVRTFLSQAYYCNEVWQNRLNSPILQKVNLDILYHELDQRFQKTRQISAVDVDIFANSVKDDLFIDELLDLVHKLRLSPNTGSTLNSTSTAVIRALLDHNKIQELLHIIDDRLNYGIFLDDHTANILLDHFWKNKNPTYGALIASQMMLQEDFTHPLTTALSLLHCHNYLQKPEEWPRPEPVPEPEDEVKIRVKYLRNPYDDNHFDLREPARVVGKTLAAAAKGVAPLETTLRLVGLALYGDAEATKREAALTKSELIKEIVDLVPEENPLKPELAALKAASHDVAALLAKAVADAAAATSERDIAKQCDLFTKWERERSNALEVQKQRLIIAERLSQIEQLQRQLKAKEQKLWFFEKEEDIELHIEEKAAAPVVVAKASGNKPVEETYVPPEITVKRHNV